VVIKENLPTQFAWRETSTGTVRPRHNTGGDADDYEWSMKNFLREAETIALLDHPGIVRVLRKFETNGTAYFVMPYVEGEALDHVIAERQKKGQTFTEEELLGLTERILNALSYLHDRGIYHRDIKPANILITMEGIPVLIDFGSARQRLSERSMTVIESPGYTPFEQLQSRGNVGPWSDLYALAGTLVKAITGDAPPKAMDRMRKDPFLPLTERGELQSRFSKAFLRSLDHALAVDEGERWQEVGQWLASLRGKISAGLPVPKTQTKKPNKFQELPLGSKSKQLPWLVISCVVLILGVCALIKSNSKVDDATARRAQDLDQQRLTEAANARATEAEERATRAEQEQQSLIAQAKVNEETMKLAEQQRSAEAAANMERQRLTEEASKVDLQRLAEAAARAEKQRLAEEAAKAEKQRLAEAAAMAEKQRLAEAAAMAEKQRLAEASAMAEKQRLAASATRVIGSFFTLGSSKDEVLAIQGTPRSISGSTFWYEYSTVEFKDDRVSSWSNISKNLKVRLAPASGVVAKQSFTLGSTKDEVLAVQGTPKSISGSTFWYEYSTVEFKGDRVSSWSNISKNLKVNLPPAR
jgi:serine/threonine protein kinase